MTRPPVHARLRRAAAVHADIVARLVTAVLGVWLVLSTVLWEHYPTARLNTGLVGGLIAVSALGALRMPVLRRATMALSAWLFTVTLLAPRPIHLATLWNDLLVAAGVFVLSSITRGGPEEAPVAAGSGRASG